MLIVFDVDGTLIGGEGADWACFDGAVGAVLGLAPGVPYFSSDGEMTARAIAQSAILVAGRTGGAGLEERIHDEYLGRLWRVHAADPQAFPARAGARELLAHLRSRPGVQVAIATGDWHGPIAFKLAAAGIDIDQVPIATSSDRSVRAEIIALAAERAGRPLGEVVYVGDGLWDLRACRALGVPFVGTGRRLPLLREAGARHVVEDFAPDQPVERVAAALAAMA
jgi:phosphoglycolate phosphatase-like HAD superfamily hydrolase